MKMKDRSTGKVRALSAQDYKKLDDQGKQDLQDEVEANGEKFSDYEAHRLKMMPRVVTPREIKWRNRR